MTTILILSIVGIVAVIAELVLPGGILGVIGAVCLVGAVVLTFLSYGATAGTVAFALLVLVGILALHFWMRLFHRLPLTRQLVLNESVGVDAALLERQRLTGRTGTALTDLHPSGRGEFDGEKVDVVAEGGEIRKGSAIEIVETRGPSIIVRERKE